MQTYLESHLKIEVLHHPFPCLIIDDFLPPSLLESVSAELARTDENSEALHPAGYRFRAFLLDEFVRFLYKFVRLELTRHLPGTYGWSKVYRLPQTYRTDRKAHV